MKSLVYLENRAVFSVYKLEKIIAQATLKTVHVVHVLGGSKHALTLNSQSMNRVL